MRSRKGLFARLALALVLLAPGFLAGEVVPASKPFEIVPPLKPHLETETYYHMTATVTSLGPQGFAVGGETNYDHPYDYGEWSFNWGRRLLADGSVAEHFVPTTWLDLEDGWVQELSFANFGEGRFLSVACASSYDTYEVLYRRFVAGQDPPDPESVFWDSEGSDSEPHIASNGNGIGVMAWVRLRDDETRQEVAQVFSWGGESYTPEIAVTERVPTPGWPWNYSAWSDPLVGMDADGNFVVLLQDHGTWGRRFDRTGKPLGERFWIGGSWPLALVMAPSGEFVVAWRAPVQPGRMLLSRFTADGRRTGPLVRLTWSGTAPSMALDRSGRVALFWIDESRRPILKVFDASLAPLGQVAFDTPVSSRTFSLGTQGGVAFGDDGRILTVWVGPRGGHRIRDSVLGRFWKIR